MKLAQQMTQYKEGFDNVDLCKELIEANDYVKYQNVYFILLIYSNYSILCFFF